MAAICVLRICRRRSVGYRMTGEINQNNHPRAPGRPPKPVIYPQNFSFLQSFRTLVVHGRCYPVAGRNVLRAFEEEFAVASRMRHENGFQIKGSTVGEILVRIVAILFTAKKELTQKRNMDFNIQLKINEKLKFNTTILKTFGISLFNYNYF